MTATTKAFFSIYPNKGDNAGKTTFRVFKEDKTHEDVKADYFISARGADDKLETVGSAIKSKSKAGNGVLRVNVKVGDSYWMGTLNFSQEGLAALKAKEAQPEGQRSAVYGTFSNKDRVEKEVSGWVKLTKNGDPYLSCTMADPYRTQQQQQSAPSAAAQDNDDDLPF